MDLHFYAAYQSSKRLADTTARLIDLLSYYVELDQLDAIYRRIRVRNRLTNEELIYTGRSPWYAIYHQRNDEAFLDATGLNVAAFDKVLEAFKQTYVVRSGPGRVGRPTTLRDKGAALALVLHHYRGSMNHNHLCEMFGIAPGTLERCLYKAETALFEALPTIPEARFNWPTLEQQREMASRVHDKYPLLHGRFGFVDGKNYRVLQPTVAQMQNAYYNGTFVSVRCSVLIFTSW